MNINFFFFNSSLKEIFSLYLYTVPTAPIHPFLISPLHPTWVNKIVSVICQRTTRPSLFSALVVPQAMAQPRPSPFQDHWAFMVATFTTGTDYLGYSMILPDPPPSTVRHPLQISTWYPQGAIMRYFRVQGSWHLSTMKGSLPISAFDLYILVVQTLLLFCFVFDLNIFLTNTMGIILWKRNRKIM